MFKKLKIIVILLLSLTLLTSCNFGLALPDNLTDYRGKKTMNSILDSLEQDDREGIKKLFSQNAIKDAKDFEGQLDDFFELFNSGILSVEDISYSESKRVSHGQAVRTGTGECTVKTDRDRYIFLFRICVRDSDDQNNQGLWAVRVFPAEDELFYTEEYDPIYKPWGTPGAPPDKPFDVPGIFTPQAPEVVIENEEDATFKRVVDSLGLWNKNGVRNVFAYSVMAEYEGYEEQLSALFDYYEGNYQSFERREYSEKEHLLHGNVVILETWAVYEVKTDKQEYLFIFYSTPKYNADGKMRGIQSLRVIRAEDEAKYFPDWSVVEENPGIFVPQE